jgi:hypothetical protein
VGLEFELRAYVFAKQALYHLSHTSSPFCSGYFADGIIQSIFLGWVQNAAVARIIE